MLNWAQRFNIFCFLDNHQYHIKLHQYECLLAVGAQSSINGDHSTLKELDDFLEKTDWAFGHLSYELKNVLFNLKTIKKDAIGFPLFFFFQPQILFIINGEELNIEAPDPDDVYHEILTTSCHIDEEITHPACITPRLTKEAYLEKINQLLQHIQRGDCYEINFCQTFFAREITIHPLMVYQQLSEISPTPFAAFYKLDNRYLICASPERFLQKKGNRIFAQPMKGTAKRYPLFSENAAAMKELQSNLKERAENVMIVDLMRNDLSKFCVDGSVKVRELFGVYTFPQVNQMVSTIEGKTEQNIPFSQIIEATFPMGSMTGAPKKTAVELIDRYEESGRGLFSGSVGYWHQKDFDLNVIIRSLFYNDQTRYLSYMVGSGITIYSDAEKEWEECLLKAKAIKKVLTGSQH